MDYSFNSEIAEAVGVDCAVFIHNLYWWIRKNEANGRHYYNGKTWTYNSYEAFTNLFPFWTGKQVRRIIAKLKDDGYIFIDNFNSDKRDRTQWYALSQDVYDIYSGIPKREDCKCPDGQMSMPKSANEELSIYNNIYNTTDIKQQILNNKKGQLPFCEIIENYSKREDLRQALHAFVEMRAKVKKPLTEYALKLRLEDLDKLTSNEEMKVKIVNQSVANCWQDFYSLKGADNCPKTYTAEAINKYFENLTCEDL